MTIARLCVIPDAVQLIVGVRKMKNEFNLSQEKKVIKFDFATARQRRDWLQELLKPGDDKISLCIEDPDNGANIGLVYAMLNKRNASALLHIILLNPDYVKDGQAWMVCTLPDVVDYLRDIGVRIIYTNLSPSFSEAIEGYLQFGFVHMEENDCFSCDGVTYVSLRYSQL